MTRSLVPPTPDRSLEGRAERKRDLANRLRAQANEHYARGWQDRGDFFMDLAHEARVEYLKFKEESL